MFVQRLLLDNAINAIEGVRFFFPCITSVCSKKRWGGTHQHARKTMKAYISLDYMNWMNWKMRQDSSFKQ